MAWSRKSLHLTAAGGPPALPEAFTEVPEYELGTSFLGTEAREPFLRCWSLRDWAAILGGPRQRPALEVGTGPPEPPSVFFLLLLWAQIVSRHGKSTVVSNTSVFWARCSPWKRST